MLTALHGRHLKACRIGVAERKIPSVVGFSRCFYQGEYMP